MLKNSLEDSSFVENESGFRLCILELGLWKFEQIPFLYKVAGMENKKTAILFCLVCMGYQLL